MLAFITMVAGCSADLFEEAEGAGKGDRIHLSGEIDQQAVTRVDDNGFTDGDVIGVYIVDYEGNNPGKLQASGNRGNNVRYTFNATDNQWNSAYNLYFKDQNTPIDVYGYYPYGNPEDVNAYPFSVQADQSTPTVEGVMGGYEASDFLWGKVGDVAPTANVIHLPLRHCMANARVVLVEGSGFAEGEWEQTEKNVVVSNLVREATINLADGSVIPTGKVDNTSTVPSKRGDEWRAIVVPQTVKAATTLFGITIGGLPYKFTKQENFTYTASKMSNFTIRVDKKADTGRYRLTLVSESITPWENDLVSHDATMKEYVIVHTERGGLKEAIAALNKDYQQVRNLKLTGSIDKRDYLFMRGEMSNLQFLNLKEVASWGTSTTEGKELKGVIPSDALPTKESLLRVIFPDDLIEIGENAFIGCSNLSGPVILPEGLKYIGYQAFYSDFSLDDLLILPSTLEYIGDMAFYGCQFSCELVLPTRLKYIGSNAFYGNDGLYGNLVLPEGLETLGSHAFLGCSKLTGDLVIPQAIKDIPEGAFCNTGLNGKLLLHDGVTSISQDAFSGAPLKGGLVLPKRLAVIARRAFRGCNFSGELILPESLISLGNYAFAENDRLTGVVTFPDELSSIGAGVFANCTMLEGLVFSKNVTIIKSEAFHNCTGIVSIVSKAIVPPHLMSGAFEGVNINNFTLEVPEASIDQYKTATGWTDFKRVAAHHELVCRPSVTCALNKQREQTLLVDAEGEWELQSKPDWCKLSQTSGDKKTEVTLTIKSLPKGAADREGKIVFKLKEREYTHTCVVRQYDYEYDEDQYLTLQRASKGNNGGINIVVLGDGYDAKDISSGVYLTNVKREVESFFSIEPYKTYRNYFNVYTAFPLSPEAGIGTVNSVCDNRFNTVYAGYAGLQADYNEIFRYALDAPTVTKDNLKETLIIILPNSSDYSGVCQMWEDGSAIAFCPPSTNDYPFDTRGVIQHEAGGHGFGKLGDECIYYNTFIDEGTKSAIRDAKARGWFENLSLVGKMHVVPWSHLIQHEKFGGAVDVFEGGYKYSRGVFRSELNSCMNNNIPYYNAISRESIVKRIKRYAGETFSFDEFVANDKNDGGSRMRSMTTGSSATMRSLHFLPKMHRGKPRVH